MNLPSGARGRLVAVAILFIVLVLFTSYGIQPMLGAYTAMSDDVAAMRDDIRRYRKALAALPSVREAAQSIDTTRPLAPYLLSGDSETLAAARLQRRLRDAAKAHDVRVLSLRVQPPSIDGQLQRVSVEMRLLTDTNGLKNLLFSSSTSTPYLFVDQMSIRARRGRRADSANADMLDVNLTFFGFRTPDV